MIEEKGIMPMVKILDDSVMIFEREVVTLIKWV